jgi:hypothetical protein
MSARPGPHTSARVLLSGKRSYTIVLSARYYNVERLCIVYPRVFESYVAHEGKNQRSTKNQRALVWSPTQAFVYCSFKTQKKSKNVPLGVLSNPKSN